MTRFVHLTDLHISHPDLDDPHLSSDTAATLARAVQMINTITPAPDFVVLSGDLTNCGDAASYGLVRDLIAPLQMPVLHALGNHDTRPGYRAAFPETGGCPEAPLFHHSVQGALHVIVLDSSIPGRIAGGLDAEQLALLDRALAEHADLPKLLVCHHPPHFDRPGALDWESLNAGDTAALARILRGHPIAGMLSGHIHINRVLHWQGFPVVISTGLHNTLDILEPADLVILEGSGFALCDHGPAGLDARFVPLGPVPRKLGRIDEEMLRGFR
ncbi:metallophosphoesterase family protein [Pukyongiella litopenaei]|nr:metallophosphoesterase [Pukyongiella litopenaei]